ncbi:DUF4309 domain-containing protein [Halalkalibacter krulwichiae]|uniref:DUF4309 domain-containing protein n=1 Tax=Halalkalibacter krulwichiae TaxID=199441 RepID=A0A1X9MKM2_9BACI|nr:DUF4309 domain-containing protein [Halalkalibacter krulwichiae]ARK31192.1 hypothetical protein BkAM31D_15755 [Halalkalibacter krulwichiae]
MQKKWLLFVVFFLLTACGQGNMIVEQQVDFTAGHISTSEQKSFLSFSWIEKGYDGVFIPTNTKLGETEEDIRESFGVPITTGSYEGGIFLEYSQATFFINPETKKSVAIASDISDERITFKDLKRLLGTPDSIDYNEMDDFWMYVYDLDEYELVFESVSEQSELSFVWLKSKQR